MPVILDHRRDQPKDPADRFGKPDTGVAPIVGEQQTKTNFTDELDPGRDRWNKNEAHPFEKEIVKNIDGTKDLDAVFADITAILG